LRLYVEIKIIVVLVIIVDGIVIIPKRSVLSILIIIIVVVIVAVGSSTSGPIISVTVQVEVRSCKEIIVGVFGVAKLDAIGIGI